GNAVALDTPASVVALLRALAAGGYRVDRIPEDGDTLMAELIDTFSYERETLTAEQLARAQGRWPAAAYTAWFASLPAPVRDEMVARWGPPPGEVYVHAGAFAFPGLDLGGVRVVDHLLPPMTRAGTYDELARLESLLDEHAAVAALDPAKLPAIRRQVWDVLVDAEIHRDLGVADAPEGDGFDELVLHVDGYLCELKDALVRGGLHTLGRAPDGDEELDLLLALTRLPQGDVPA